MHDQFFPAIPAPAGAMWCVAWTRDEDGRRAEEEVWCALVGKPDPDVEMDETVCDHVVCLRSGLEHMLPTCRDCIEALEAALSKT